jgi:hypothetical protein
MGRRTAAFGLILGGVIVAVGSLATWDICPDSSCGDDGGLLALMHLVDRSGIEVGLGIVTLVLGAALALVGLDAVRRGGWSPVRWLAVALALLAIAVAATFLGRTYAFGESLMYGPGVGIYLVAFGAVLAAIAGFRLQQASHIKGKPV